ncbi:hypothetical protein EDB83DRAFT_180795 [Lactarius deliciosus]|nr:hypothetical protein EDB83DRAFT_180795 [Lactarius deliciosus]
MSMTLPRNRDPVYYDPYILRNHLKNIGRAYREQATTLIEICRLYVDTFPQTYTVNDKLQNIFRLADAALSAAGRAGKGTTAEAKDAFLQAEPGGHRKQLFDPITALGSASEKDKKSMSTLSRVKSVFKPPIPSGNTKKVNFVVVESLPHVEWYNRGNRQLYDHQRDRMEVQSLPLSGVPTESESPLRPPPDRIPISIFIYRKMPQVFIVNFIKTR